jgi:hypothetical protein
MYCNEVVEQRLEAAREENGWLPEYHSILEIETFEQKLKARFPKEYEDARLSSAGGDDPSKAFQIYMMRALCSPNNPKLTVDEIRFMENERTLVQCDAAYYMTRHYHIKNRENILQYFTFQTGQKILFNVIAEMERMGVPIEIQIAKARQLGCTTEIQGLIGRYCEFTYGASGVVASADRTKTGEMVKMMLMGYDMQHWWLRPLTSRRVESQNGMITWGAMNSGISFQHGNQVNPIAMGSTPITYHLSEVSSYYDAASDLIDVGLFKCVHPSPRVLGFLESTCKGNTGYWSDTYWFSKENWAKGGSRLMALFLPFYCGTDMYPNETWLRAHPIPRDWRPCDETRQMIAESELYVKSNPVLEKVLKVASGSKGDWKMGVAQSWYWEVNYLEHRAKGREKDWFQEMPHTDKAAFQGSYDNVFGREVIAEAWTNRDTKYSVYGIVGQSIQERHEPDPDEVDNSLPRLTVKRDNRKGEPFQWEFVPLFWQEPFEDLDSQAFTEDESHMGKLFVWLEPEPGYDYSIGVDTSKGVGKDGTVVAVSRRGRSASERDVQAAEWRDNYVSHVEAWAWALAIASYYSRYMGQHGIMFREPYVAIEQIEAVGDTCQDQMSLCGYSRFHRMIRYDSMPKQMKKSKAHKRGWFTVGWSRPMLTDGFVVNTQNGWYQVNSPYTIWEMDHWEVHYTRAGTKEKFEHGEDTTDDGIFANALASFCPNDRKMQADRSENKFRQATSRVPELDLTPTKAGYFVPETGYASSRDRDIRALLAADNRRRR